ncbi:MAG TPA: DUF3060 domain-containing protein [Pyrinomonadaceae bacterium]|jgi:hypothetical protein|nr:DUF3060 domain-containing protein [Pyrinomonadaceae bacterium]
MKNLSIIFLVVTVTILSACEPSGTAKKEMEKFSGTPTPMITPTPEQTPIPAGDILAVDTELDGDILTVNREPKKTLNCTKYNLVAINADASVVTINGACQKVTVNGDNNQITVDAAKEFAFNGSGNNVTYSRFVNGKQPIVTQNQPGNEVGFMRLDDQKKATDSNKTKK